MGIQSLICPQCKQKNNPSFKKCWKCNHGLMAEKKPSELEPWPEKGDAAKKKEWFLKTKPWNKVGTRVIDALIQRFDKNPMFVVFVALSMDQNLIGGYAELDERLGHKGDTDLICSQIAVTLCLLGNEACRAVGGILVEGRLDTEKLKLYYGRARDAYETAIILDHNQIQAYHGMALTYGLINKTKDSKLYAKQGLLRLEELRRDKVFNKYIIAQGAESSDSIDAIERSLRMIVEAQ